MWRFRGSNKGKYDARCELKSRERGMQRKMIPMALGDWIAAKTHMAPTRISGKRLRNPRIHIRL